MERTHIQRREYLIVFLFCMATVIGNAITVFLDNDVQSHCVDCKIYLRLSHFEVLHEYTRKYRIIIPFLATGLSYILKPLLALAPAQ